jgi:hypothetical protein
LRFVPEMEEVMGSRLSRRIRLPALARLLAASGAVVALAAGLLTGAAPASAAPDSAAPAASGPYCAVVLAALKPGETVSNILRRGCSSTPEGLRSVTAGSTFLFSGCEHRDYGSPCFNWSGANGPCRTASYSIVNLANEGWNDRISSWVVQDSSCSAVKMWEHAAFGGRSAFWHWYTRVPYIGDTLNDRVSSMTLAYQP